MLLRFVLSNKILISALFSLVYCTFILPINESIWFDVQHTTIETIAYSRILKLIFGVGLFFASWFILHFIEKLRSKDLFYLSWIKSSITYGALLLVLLLLIFPGYWSWDDFWVLDSAHAYLPNTWQHIFTQAQYIFSLYLFPSSTTITVVQLGIIATIAGYVVAYLKQFLTSKRLRLLLWLPFLTLPVLFGDFYTLRLHIYGYLLLLLAIKVHQIFSTERRPMTHRSAFFLGITTLITVLAFWRSEGIVFLALLPLFFVKLGFLKQLRTKDRKSLHVLHVSICAVFIIILGYLGASYENSPRYKVTTTVNPLSVLVQGQDTSTKDWQNINKVINIDLLKKNPDYTDIKVFWDARFLRADYEQYLSEYYRSFANIVLANPAKYMKIKTKTFLATNSLYPIGAGETIVYGSGLLTPYSIDKCEHLSRQECDLVKRFDKMSKLNTPIAPQLRETVLNILMVDTPSKQATNILRAVFWNVLPILLLTIGVLAHAIIKRHLVWIIMVSLPLAQAAIIFLTAPASFFMYYYPTYLTGFVLVLFYSLLIIDKRNTRLSHGSAEEE